jgi:hypothetical protein
MRHQYYKPNPNVTGCLCGFEFNTGKDGKSPCVYLNFVKQLSWDKASRTGKFDGYNVKSKANFKFGVDEMGGMLAALAGGPEFTAFHSFDDSSSRVNLLKYDGAGDRYAYSLKVSKKKGDESINFVMGLTVGEAMSLRIYLQQSLVESFRAKSYDRTGNVQKENAESITKSDEPW